jgi:iron complex transport system substrate-binding protein
MLSVFDPWQRSNGEKIVYILGEDPSEVPDSLKQYPFIRTPVSKVVVFSTTHIGFIASLNEANGISGVSGLNYVCNPSVIQAADRNKVFEVGYPPNVNFERLVELSPDLVFLYGIESSINGIADRLQKLGIPVILIAEYLEAHPLGKLEWIRVFGQLYGKEDLSTRIFTHVCEEYHKLDALTDSIQMKPSVLIGLPWKNTWHLAGGQSNIASLINDAGGDYLWKEDGSLENIPLSLEAAMVRSLQADVWINTGTAGSLNEIQGRDRRFTRIEAYQKGRVFNNNARMCENGGNAYWESGVVEPHLILQDLIKILHPELLPQKDFAYYRKLE